MSNFQEKKSQGIQRMRKVWPTKRTKYIDRNYYWGIPDIVFSWIHGCETWGYRGFTVYLLKKKKKNPAYIVDPCSSNLCCVRVNCTHKAIGPKIYEANKNKFERRNKDFYNNIWRFQNTFNNGRTYRKKINKNRE